MFIFYLYFLCCKCETTIFFVTSRLYVAYVPLEMIQFCIEEIVFPKTENSDTKLQKKEKITLMKLRNKPNEFTIESIVRLTISRLLNIIGETKITPEIKAQNVKNLEKYVCEQFYEHYLSRFLDHKAPIHFLVGAIVRNCRIKYNKNIDHDLIFKVFAVLDIILSKADEISEFCSTIRKCLIEIWTRRIISEYMQKKHGYNDVNEAKIITYNVCTKVFFVPEKMSEILKSIAFEIRKNEMTDSIVLLEPLYFLHSALTFLYNVSDKKRQTFCKMIENDNFTFNLDKNSIESKIIKDYECRVYLRDDYSLSDIISFYKQDFLETYKKVLDDLGIGQKEKRDDNDQSVIFCASLHMYFSKLYKGMIDALESALVYPINQESISFKNFDTIKTKEDGKEVQIQTKNKQGKSKKNKSIDVNKSVNYNKSTQKENTSEDVNDEIWLDCYNNQEHCDDSTSAESFYSCKNDTENKVKQVIEEHYESLEETTSSLKIDIDISGDITDVDIIDDDSDTIKDDIENNHIKQSEKEPNDTDVTNIKTLENLKNEQQKENEDTIMTVSDDLQESQNKSEDFTIKSTEPNKQKNISKWKKRSIRKKDQRQKRTTGKKEIQINELKVLQNKVLQNSEMQTQQETTDEKEIQISEPKDLQKETVQYSEMQTQPELTDEKEIQISEPKDLQKETVQYSEMQTQPETTDEKETEIKEQKVHWTQTKDEKYTTDNTNVTKDSKQTCKNELGYKNNEQNNFNKNDLVIEYKNFYDDALLDELGLEFLKLKIAMENIIERVLMNRL